MEKSSSSTIVEWVQQSSRQPESEPQRAPIATCDDEQPSRPKIESAKKRYFILFMFSSLNLIKGFQWISLAGITNVIASFYNVDNYAVNWTTISFMITFITLSLPISWLMSLVGLRKSVIIGTLGVTSGVIVKCFSCHPDGFLLNFIGHVIIGCAEPFFFSIYAQVASVWFPDNQVSLATSVGIVGEQLGYALGFVVPSLMVGNDPDDTERVRAGLFRLSFSMAVISVINSALILVFFDEQPKHAPGFARLNQIQQQQIESIAQRDFTLNQRIRKPLCELGQLISDRNFINLLAAFGINLGTNYALHTVLNQLILSPFHKLPENEPQDAAYTAGSDHQTVGDVGLILIVSGLFGLLVFGHMLDRLHRFKAISIVSYLLGLIWLVIFTGGMYFKSDLAIYLLAAPLGFFVTAYAGCGFEYGVELTYPQPELLTSTLLNISAQIFGIPITFAASYIVDNYGSLASGMFLSASLTVGLLLTCLQRGELKRQNAINSSGSSS